MIAKNIESSTIYNMQELHSSSFLRLRVVVHTKLDKIADPIRKFLINPNILYYIIFSSDTYKYL